MVLRVYDFFLLLLELCELVTALLFLLSFQLE